jgi:predicted ATPase/DNA-binding winged helix-turn-helix (wHTH) protein
LHARGIELCSNFNRAAWSIVVIQDQTPAQAEHPGIGPNASASTEPNDAPASQSVTISFGPFRLSPAARAFEKDGVPLALGNRALDILTVLLERAGEVVSHRELITRVWRGLVVDPSNLRVHMTGLRKALGDRDGKERYIANVTGQGYCFVAPVRREAAAARRIPEYPSAIARQQLVLPAVLARMVGRDEAVRTIAVDLIADRFVTIIGPGGMGKTTVAVSVSHAMLEEFGGAVCFVDIGAITDPKLVATTVASTLGLTIQTDDVLPALMLCLRTLRVLLVLDNCEHVIDAAAMLAERIFQEAPGVHILATSREAMRVEGEHAYWLPPLESPSPEGGVKAIDALKFPAVKLFLERAAASGSRFELSDADVPFVAGICERLDGIPLAIEFAGARVAAHGIAGTADLLKNRLGLHWPGRRTALPRHQTLHALLDWSYSFLTEPERLVLRRLSIFVGSFTVEAAQAIACEDGANESHIVDAMDSLVAKSLISAVAANDTTRYRLLETTRVYAMEKLEEAGEKHAIALRHAHYFSCLLARLDGRVSHGARVLGEHLGNMRTALEWVFSNGGTTSNSRRVAGKEGARVRDPILAVDLTVGAVPSFLELSLLSECHKWSSAALLLLDDTMRGSRQEMVLQEAVAVTSTWTRGNGDDVRAAIMRALEIAHASNDTSTHFRLLAGLHMFLLRAADIRGSLAVAEELENAARIATDASYGVVANWLLGCSHHFMGNQSAAREHLERGLACSGHLNTQLFGLDYRLRALIVFQRVLWLSGFPDRALEIARSAIREAEASGNPVNICFACLYTAPVFLWCGELAAAHDVLERLMTHPNWHALPSLHATAFALQGEQVIRQGECERGLALLRSALPMMRADRQTIQLARASSALAEGLATAGQLNEALTVIGNAIAETEAGTETSQFPELLRVQADILVSMPSTDEALAEAVIGRAFAEARRQCALAWELRASMTLARLRSKQRRGQEGRQQLAAVFARFTQGFGTVDLVAAKRLLAASG